MPYYVYIILCKDNTFYTGHTKDVDSRLKLHSSGKASRYTRTHKPKRIVYVEEFGTRAEAMRRERGIKKLNHSQKLRLARSSKRTPPVRPA